MIRRLLIASAILATTLSGVAMNAARDTRPALLYFRSEDCDPCKQFVRDTTDQFGRDTRFMKALRSEFRIVPSYPDWKYPAVHRQWNVTHVPTWIVIDSGGNELLRVVGYDGPQDLWKQLTCRDGACRPLPRVNQQPAPPPRSTDPSPQPPVRSVADSELLKRISAANQKLENKRDSLQASLRDLSKQLLQLKQTTDTNEVEKDRPPVPPSSNATPDISTEISDAAGSTGDRWASAARWIIATGVKLAAPEWSVPISGVIAAATWLRRRRKGATADRQTTFRSAEAPKSESTSPVEDAMPLPRDLDEARELLQLRLQEGRHALHDGLFGVLAEAELEKLVEAGDPTAVKLQNQLFRRLNEIAPLSTNV